MQLQLNPHLPLQRKAVGCLFFLNRLSFVFTYFTRRFRGDGVDVVVVFPSLSLCVGDFVTGLILLPDLCL